VDSSGSIGPGLPRSSGSSSLVLALTLLAAPVAQAFAYFSKTLILVGVGEVSRGAEK
jgi:hypothetical protein